MAFDGSAPRQHVFDLADAIFVDGFAGFGGVSEGFVQAYGISPHVAINHNARAVSAYRANHPHAETYLSGIYEVDPKVACRGRPVGIFHISPDCRDHSQAKGGQPRDKKIRALAWVMIRWAGQVKPIICTLENVVPILKWSPMIAKRDVATGRVVKIDGTVAARGERVPVQQQHLVPDPMRLGQTWRRFLALLRSHGYTEIGVFTMNAARYGSGTSRERLFMMARRDGVKVNPPMQTHAVLPARGLKRWSTAADHLDFSLPSRSIFGRKKNLADASLRRIASGVVRYVVESLDPFIIPSQFYSDTPCTLPGPEAVAELLSRYYVPKSSKARGSLIVPHAPGATPGQHERIVTGHLIQFRGNCDARSLREPLRTITAGGEHHGLVQCTLAPHLGDGSERLAAFLVRYYGTGGQWSDLRDPLATITTRDRMALVTVVIRGLPYVIVDIRLRLLSPRELASCQGLPAGYILDRGHDGQPFTRTQSIHMIGNSVCPQPYAALLRANQLPSMLQLAA